ncbi:MAG TPA: D-alanyl-D-alanine carboxypeptidase family protein [Solirubrobacteraceae bacterium]|nr:D-alanyl-D-alanine carboxypeptidase family protein [Solirubrobacteraceae bacterium]
MSAAIVTLAVSATLAVMASAASALTPPSLSVRSAILVEESTGHELYGVAPNDELAIASATKLMTALVTLQHVRHLDQIFTAPDWYASPADSQIGIVPGDRMTVHDLMLAMMLPSADDAAEDLASNVGGGSVGRFVGMMNADARALGLRQTHYSTPIGLDTPGNYSTAADLVKLSSYLLEHNRFFARIVAEPSATLDTGPAHYVVNRNDLVAEYPWIKGVKTGHTDDAGYVLVAAGVQHGMTLISAVLGTDSEAARDANTLALLDWGFANFHMATLVRSGEVLARPAVSDQPGRHAAVIARTGFSDVLQNGTRASVRVYVPRELSGPLAAHAVVGYALVRAHGRTLARIPLVLAQRLVSVSSLTEAARFITRPFTLLVVLLLLGLAAGLITRRRGHSRAQAEALSR